MLKCCRCLLRAGPTGPCVDRTYIILHRLHISRYVLRQQNFHLLCVGREFSYLIVPRTGKKQDAIYSRRKYKVAAQTISYCEVLQ